jgi:transposase
VLLVSRDMPVEEVARIVAARPWAVYNWVRKYLRTRDPDSLHDAPRSGHPKVAEAITGEVILQEMSQDPMELGYNATGWTVGLLAAHLRRKYGEDLSDQTLRRRMHETGLRWKRPRYVYSTKDPNRGQKKGVLYAG